MTKLILGVGLLAIVAAAACSEDAADAPSDTTVDDAGTTPDAAARADFSTSTCGSCVQTACKAPIDACNADPECSAYVSCLLACPAGADGDVDAACAAACPTGSSTESKRAAAALGACRTVGAGASCDGCGAPASGPTSPVLNQTCGASTETSACIVCQDEHCCESYEACKANEDCVGVQKCLLGCTGDDNQACLYACADGHSEGTRLYGAKVSCNTYHCGVDQPSCDATQRDACEKCQYEDCADAYARFASGPHGYELQLCIGTCPVGDTGCDTTCYKKYPDALDAYFDYGECLGVCKGC